MTSNAFRIWAAILAGLQVVAAASVLADVTSPTIAALIAIIVAAAQAGTGVYAGTVGSLPKDSAPPRLDY